MNTPPPPFASYIREPEDLKTSYAATRAGFIRLALERNRRATPLVAEAKAIRSLASDASSPVDLLKIPALRHGLVTAAGVSDKARKYFSEEDKDAAIQKLISDFLEPAGTEFVEELVYRFLLTRGDALGGAMRNIGGRLAASQMVRALIANLTVVPVAYQWLDRVTGQWAAQSESDAGVEERLKGLSWVREGKFRVLLIDTRVPFVEKNIDVVLLGCNPVGATEALGNPEHYLALGELKGGIDPAGADEHWKTASKAFNRIRAPFEARQLRPSLFFVGAAIEIAMAKEIWQELQDGYLDNAANLTNDQQLNGLCRWLISI